MNAKRTTISFLLAASLGVAVVFITLFPASPWDTTTRITLRAEAAHLPVIRDAYLAPAPPAFLPSLTAPDISFIAIKPEPRALLNRQADKEQPLASLTKLMTAYVVLKNNPDWNAVVTFSKDDVRGGAHTPLTPGATVTVGDLWKLSLIASDNDATAALAGSIGLRQDQFAAAMNETASSMGLAQMHFVEPTGLNPGNVATARDFAAFTRTALDEPMIRDTVALPETYVTVSGNKVRVLSSDQLLKFHEARSDGWTFIAGKTGFVDESGYNVALVAQANTGEEMLLVLLGSQSAVTRASEADKLLAWGAQILARTPQ